MPEIIEGALTLLIVVVFLVVFSEAFAGIFNLLARLRKKRRRGGPIQLVWRPQSRRTWKL